MLLFTKRLLLTGAGLLGGGALAIAGPYSANCPDGYCTIDHADHCADGHCDVAGHNHAAHSHADHDHAGHDHTAHNHPGHDHPPHEQGGPAHNCEEGCEHHDHSGLAGHHHQHDAVRPQANQYPRTPSGIGNEPRWNDRMGRQPFSSVDGRQPMPRENRYLGDFPSNRRPSTWDERGMFGTDPGPSTTYPYPQALDRRPATRPSMPRPLPTRDYNDLTVSRPQPW